DRVSPDEVNAIDARCAPHDAALRATGRLREVSGLAHGVAASIRPPRAGSGGAPTVTDGPFSEAKEIVGSLWIVEAESLEEAVRITSLHPAANIGAEMGWGIEVRPIAFHQDFGSTPEEN